MAKQSAIDKRILELMTEIKEREIAIEVLESVKRPVVKAKRQKKVKPSDEVQP